MYVHTYRIIFAYYYRNGEYNGDDYDLYERYACSDYMICNQTS